jgi:hypothetical protein
MTPIKSSGSNSPMGSAWLTPFPVEVRGMLRGMINQYADSTSTILTPKTRPNVKVEPFGYIATIQ